MQKIGLKYPTRVSINITRKCNLRCPHCFSSSGLPDESELTTKELFNLIDQLKENGKPTLAIGGGEPLIREDIFEVLAYAKKQGVPASMVTNSLLLTKEKAQKLNSLNLVSITVSIDGLEKNHDFMRGEGNFKKAIKNIKLLRKYINTAELAMRVTVNTKNIGECKKLIKLAESLKLDNIRLTPVLPVGRAKEHLDLLITQEQYLKFLKDCRSVKAKIQIVLPDNNSNLSNIREGEFGCHCGREICWITQTGDLYPCIFYEEGYIAGNIRNESFANLWEKSKELVRFCGNEYCNNCSNYKNCRGGCRARALWIYNDINAIDPYCPLKKNKL
jgi:radical SAM protein with 4Fe4S-binding SPASM domain